jgi:hypothetical protein
MVFVTSSFDGSMLGSLDSRSSSSTSGLVLHLLSDVENDLLEEAIGNRRGPSVYVFLVLGSAPAPRAHRLRSSSRGSDIGSDIFEGAREEEGENGEESDRGETEDDVQQQSKVGCVGRR